VACAVGRAAVQGGGAVAAPKHDAQIESVGAGAVPRAASRQTVIAACIRDELGLELLRCRK
jgi:hypothetical protein